MSVVESITHEYDFKTMADGLLRHEFGPRVHTFAGKGRDGGIDAEYVGSYGDLSGRWIFQYKFVGPDTDPVRARTRLFAALAGKKAKHSEFQKVSRLLPAPDVYVVVTNVPATVALVQKLQVAWRATFSGQLLVWDRSALNAMLHGREFLARSWDESRELFCRTQLVVPLYDLLERALAPRSPLWPLGLRKVDRPVLVSDFLSPFTWTYAWEHVAESRKVKEWMDSPLFAYAVSVLFPNSMAGIASICAECATLERRIRDMVTREIEELRNLAAFSSASEQLRTDWVLRPLAFYLFESAWGMAHHLPFIQADRIQVYGAEVFQGEVPPDVLPCLTGELERLRAVGMPDDIGAARSELQAQIYDSWKKLWWVAQLGIDYQG